MSRYLKLRLPFREFIAMMALMMSIVALSIDALLPALESIGDSMGVTNPNYNQLLIGFLFLGMAFGQLLFGPLSDSIGRRYAMVLGFTLFFLGSGLAFFSDDFTTMLISRVLQGFGLAAPRVLSIAIVRDLYEGRAMARVMSFVLMIFVLVPMIAPLFGQFILTIASWRAIFVVIAVVGLIAMGWYLLRQEETLAAEDRADFTVTRTLDALKIIFSNRVAFGYTIAAGVITGPFIFYLGSAQQLFQKVHQLDHLFPLYFATLAFVFGLASLFNGKQVMTLGMHRLVKSGIMLMTLTSIVFLFVAWWFDGLPSLSITTIYMVLIFFSIGLLFGNLNALAMEPLGHIAGIGAAVVGSLSTFISATLAVIIGLQFNNTIYPLVLSFFIAGIVVIALMRWIASEAKAESVVHSVE